MEMEGIPLAEMKEGANRLASEGRTVVFVAGEKKLLGLIGLSDVPKDSAKDAVRVLQGMGLKVAMLTGDNASTAGTIGATLGIERVLSDRSSGRQGGRNPEITGRP